MPEQTTDLSRLHDVVLPEPVSWWPLAPGWWVLAGFALALVLALTIRALRRRRTDAYRREALRELQAVDSPTAVAAILRRTALVVTAREDVAGLGGSEWIEWLASRSPAPLPEAARASLSGAIYDRSASEDDLLILKTFAARWIREHRPC